MTAMLVAAALAVTALLVPITIAGTNIALGVLSAAVLLHARGKPRSLRTAWDRPVMAAVALYAVTGLISASFGAEPHAALRDAIKDGHRLWVVSLFLAAAAFAPEAPVM